MPAQSELAGFYAQPPEDSPAARRPCRPGRRCVSATARTTFALENGTVGDWRQQLDLHTGVVTTSARWTAPNGHVTDLTYSVFTDRARQSVGAVRLTVVPHWSGTATVTDLIDGTHAPLVDGRRTRTRRGDAHELGRRSAPSGCT